MTLWPPRLAKIQQLRVSRGSGWAVGRAGVLTATSVVTGMLPGEQKQETHAAPIEVVIGAAQHRVFRCELIWYDDVLGLALLRVDDNEQPQWQEVLEDTDERVLAEPRAEAIAGVRLDGFATASGSGSTASSLAWMLAEPATGVGTLTLASRLAGRRIVEFERGALPKDAAQHGVPGAPVFCDDPVPMVLGVVTERLRPRRRRPRMDMSLLPNPAEQPAFAAALKKVGASDVVYSMDGPILRRYVTDACLDRSLRPVTVADIDDPTWFGTHPGRTGSERGELSRVPFVDRPERATLVRALDAAVDGSGPRVIILTGPSAAGKSRLAAETITAHQALAGYRMLTPKRHLPVDSVPERLRDGPTLLWLDSLHQYSAVALHRPMAWGLLAANPSLVIVATARDPVTATAAESTDDAATAGFPIAAASLSGVQSVMDDAALTTLIAVGAHPEWQVSETDQGPVADALTAAASAGVGFGEFLAGYPELADRYTRASWPTRALVDVVADWDASGIGTTLPRSAAFSLWQDYTASLLPREELRRFSRLDSEQLAELWDEAVRFASQTVAGGESLITADADGLCSSEFARSLPGRTAISAQAWDYLLNTHPTSPDTRLDLGLRALASGTPQRALRAFESILFYRDSDTAPAGALTEVIARRGIALYHTHMHQDEHAVWAYTDLIDTFGKDRDPAVAEQVAQALLGLGITFSRMGSPGQAVSAYAELVHRYGHPAYPALRAVVGRGLLGQAVTFAQMDRRDDAISAYTEIGNRYRHDDDPALVAIRTTANAALDHMRQRDR